MEKYHEKAVFDYSGKISLTIYGSDWNWKNMRWLIWDAAGGLEAFESYFKILVVKAVSNLDTFITLTGIIPFSSIVPTNKYIHFFSKKSLSKTKTELYDYFGASKLKKRWSISFYFDPTNGWNEFPVFFKANFKNIDKLLIKNNTQYQAQLQNSIAGPYIGFSFVLYDEKSYNDILVQMKNLQINKPKQPIEGEIIINNV